MNVLYCCNYNVGAVSYYIKRSLDRLGIKTFAYTPDDPIDGFQRCEHDVDIPSLISSLNVSVDMVLIVEASIHPLFAPKGLERVTVPKVWWAIDNHLNFRWHKEYANLFDIAYFAQYDYMKFAHKYGTNNVRWLPLACDPEIHRKSASERIYDLSFVGNLSPNRRVFFDKLKQKVNVSLFSGKNPWEMGEIYSQSKAVINICAREDLNMRVFEAMSCGALLVQQKINAGIEQIFIPNTHFVFHNIDDASDVINKYLSDDNLRRRIAEEGQRLVRSQHTYDNRVLQIIKEVEDLNKDDKSVKSKSLLPIQLALTYQHRDFNRSNDAKEFLYEALKKSPLTSVIYLFKYLRNYLYHRAYRLFLREY